MKKTYPTTIEALRKSGCKVLVMHRTISSLFDPKKQMETVIILSVGDTHMKGVSLNNPKDNYNRKLGNKIALGRALKNWDKKVFLSKKEFAIWMNAALTH
jgi:hypothetical protein